MRVVYSPAANDRGMDLIRQVGECRSCKKQNIVWMCKGHLITRAMLKCEHCGSFENKKKKSSSVTGIQWHSNSVWSGRVMAKNYPEKAKAGDLVV